MRTKSKVDIWWRYFFLFTALIISRPTFHFVNQALRGQPLDFNYFWSELSLEKVLAAGLYNGDGGADWKIGKPKATIWNAEQLRSLPEIKEFALEIVNRDRNLNYLPNLRQDTILSLTAQRHAEDMLARNYFSHISLEGKSPRDRYLSLGGTPGKGVAENILQSNTQGFGFTYGEAEKFQRGWMYSNGHRENLLAVQYTKFGYGIATGVDGRIYAVQMFAE